MPSRATITSLVRRMRRDERVRLHTPASALDVRRAEAQLKVKLPEDYVAFVRQVGWAELGTNTVLGLGKDARDGATNAVIVTKEARKHPDPIVWPQPHVVVMDVGNGDYYCLATELMKRGRCPVLTWYHELDERDEVAEDFVHWLDGTYRDPAFVPP